jgi:hypothetical protein
MRAHPERMQADLQILSASKNLERIADPRVQRPPRTSSTWSGMIIRHRH